MNLSNNTYLMFVNQIYLLSVKLENRICKVNSIVQYKGAFIKINKIWQQLA